MSWFFQPLVPSTAALAVAGATSPTYIANAANAMTLATNIIVDKPAGTANGHLMVMFISVSNNRTVTNPTGWKPRGRCNQIGGGDVGVYVYEKIAVSEPSTYTITQSSLDAITVDIVTYSDSDGLGTINMGTDVVTTSTTTKQVYAQAGSEMLTVTGVSNIITSTPAGVTELYNRTHTGGYIGLWVGREGPVSAGNYGGKTISVSPNFARWANMNVEVLGTVGITPPVRGNSSFIAANSVFSQAINVPSGIADGHLMIMGISARIDSLPATPSGWTRMNGVSSSAGGNTGFFLYRRVASSEPASYTITFTGFTNGAIGIISYSSWGGIAEFDDNELSFGNSYSTPSIPTDNNSEVLTFMAFDNASLTVTPATVTNIDYITTASTGRNALWVGYENPVALGTYGPKTFSSAAFPSWAGASVEILGTSTRERFGGFQVYNGTTWNWKPIRYNNGSGWQIKPLKFWTGTAWRETNT